MFNPKELRANFGDYSPYISAEIMELHYSKHYLGYLKNLNLAIEKYPSFFNSTINEILSKIEEIPEDIRLTVRNNGGGASNHEIFWEILSTTETSLKDGAFLEAIKSEFGNEENFKSEFEKNSMSSFGSGWTWLVLDKNKKLKIISTPNQDSPYMQGVYPIFGIDTWEHAYYLQYKNIRGDYLKEVWKILDWKVIEQRYLSEITKSK